MKKSLFLAVVFFLLAGCNQFNSSGERLVSVTASTSNSVKWKEGYASIDGSSPQKIRYFERNGLNIVDGDIVLSNVSPKKTTQGLVTNGGLVWDKDGIVVYDLKSMHPELKNEWLLAIKKISLLTNIRFNRDVDLYKSLTGTNYAGPVYTNSVINVIGNSEYNGGFSNVGRLAGPQVLGLSKGVFNGLIMHELMHAIGHWHEHTRADRDQYVKVNWENIQQYQEANFDIHDTEGKMVGGYDYCSIMHYGTHSFSKNNFPTLTKIKSNPCNINFYIDEPYSKAGGGYDPLVIRFYDDIGQQIGFSDGDIQAVRGKYPSVTPKRPFVFAGFDQNINNLGNYSGAGVTVTLDGSNSFPIQSTNLTYSWKPLGFKLCQAQTNYYPNPTSTSDGCYLSNPIQNNTSKIATVVQGLGSYQGSNTRQSSQKYELTVTDAFGLSMRDIVTVNITSN